MIQLLTVGGPRTNPWNQGSNQEDSNTIAIPHGIRSKAPEVWCMSLSSGTNAALKVEETQHAGKWSNWSKAMPPKNQKLRRWHWHVTVGQANSWEKTRIGGGFLWEISDYTSSSHSEKQYWMTLFDRFLKQKTKPTIPPLWLPDQIHRIILY